MNNMTKKKTDNKEQGIDNLIDSLSDDLKPVNKLAHPALRVLPWVLIALVYMAGVLHFLGIRMDISEKLGETLFLYEMLLTLGIGLTSAYAAGWLSVPDMGERPWLLAIPTALFAAFATLIGCTIICNGLDTPKIDWHHCFSDTLLMGFIPMVLLLILVRKGATTKPYWMSFMCVLSSGSLAWAAIRMSCMSDRIGHNMIFHFLPFIVLALVFSALARKIYRW